ncbi:MAG: helix-turn-helix domain-containing protein [Blautia massiliensis (ex Durand et al. 2017)]
MRETSLSISSICELTGYENPEHFMRLFKKTYGMTPGNTGRSTGKIKLYSIPPLPPAQLSHWSGKWYIHLKKEAPY